MLISISQYTDRTDHFQLVLNRRIPIVFFDRVCEEIEAAKVVVDDYKGAFEAVEYLIHSGRKRIAHLAGPPNLSIARERMAGYREALAKYGLPWRDELVVFGGLNEEDGTSGFVELLKRAEEQPPDAVFAVTDPVASGAYLMMREKGIAIPRDMALVGFSDSPLSSLIDPPLTTVRQPAYEMGKTAAELLIDQIKNNRLIIERKVLPTEFVRRGSA
jgi:DNA-binding LacI/PurR family transcriptional regulator